MSAALIAVEFTLHTLRVTCTPPSAVEAGSSFVLCIDAAEFSSPLSGGSPATVCVPLAEIEELPTLAHRLEIRGPSGAQALPSDPLLTRVDIRTPDEFLDRVQSLRNRIADPAAVRFCSRRLLATGRKAANLRAAAICAIGYRIAEGLDPRDPDLPRFWQAVGAFLSDNGAVAQVDVRWTTSVTMAAVYVAILQENAAEAIRFLRLTLSYRPHLPELSLLHTNFSRCDTMLALIELARGRHDAAVALLEDVGEVFRTGARSSWIDHPQRGRAQYSEILTVTKSMRLSASILREARTATEPDDQARVAFATRIEGMSNLVRALEQAGHWRGVLEGVRRDLLAAGGVPNAPAAPPLRRPAPRCAAPPPLADVPALLAQAEAGSAGAGSAEAAEAFTQAALALAAAAECAATEGDVAFRAEEALLGRLMALDTRLRSEGHHAWQGLLALSRARFCLALLALMQGAKDHAYTLLTQGTAWTKQVLSHAHIEADEDFEPAGMFVQCGFSIFMLAHRFAVPETALADDGAAEPDFYCAVRQIFPTERMRERLQGTLAGLRPAVPEPAARRGERRP